MHPPAQQLGHGHTHDKDAYGKGGPPPPAGNAVLINILWRSEQSGKACEGGKEGQGDVDVAHASARQHKVLICFDRLHGTIADIEHAPKISNDDQPVSYAHVQTSFLFAFCSWGDHMI